MYEPTSGQQKIRFLLIGVTTLLAMIFNLAAVAQTDLGRVRIDNHTEHDVTVYYRSEHDDHEHSLGHVHSNDAETYSLTDCNHHVSFRAIDEHGSVWSQQLHVDCGATTSWTVGHRH